MTHHFSTVCVVKCADVGLTGESELAEFVDMQYLQGSVPVNPALATFSRLAAVFTRRVSSPACLAGIAGVPSSHARAKRRTLSTDFLSNRQRLIRRQSFGLLAVIRI